MEKRALKYLVQGRTLNISSWMVLYYAGCNSSMGGLDKILDQAIAEYQAATDKGLFIKQLNYLATNDKPSGVNSHIAQGIQAVIEYGGETALSWLPADVVTWAENLGIIIRAKVVPNVQADPKGPQVTLTSVVQHPLLPNWVNLLIGLVCVALVVDVFSGWLGIPKLLAVVLAFAFGAFALQRFARNQKKSADDSASHAQSPRVSHGPTARHWVIGIVVGLVVVAGIVAVLWSTGEDVSVAEKAAPKVPAAKETPVVSSGSVITTSDPTLASEDVVVSRNKPEDTALKSVIDGYVVNMYACARSLEPMKQVVPEGNLPSTYAQLLQLNITGADDLLNSQWSSLISTVTRPKAPKDRAAWYNENDNGGRYGVYHDAVVVACSLITKDLSRVLTDWATASSTETPDFSAFDAVTTKLDEANGAVVEAALQVGVTLDEYHPDWQALKDGFTAVIRPTPVPTPRPTTAPRLTAGSLGSSSTSAGVVPPIRAAVPTPVPTPEPTIAPPFNDDPGPFPGDVLSDVPCMPSGTKAKYYSGGVITPAEVDATFSLTLLNVTTCVPQAVELHNAYVLIGAYCVLPDVCYAVVEMLDGPSRGAKVYAEGKYAYMYR